LIEAFLLVFLVVYLFLQDFKSTLIPAIAVPVAIIGTFLLANIWFLKYADVICHDSGNWCRRRCHCRRRGRSRKLDEGAKSAKEATLSAMSEIRAISITLVMSAVFIPVSF
jgi:HAE1 family hydrophobic/amphiphilic exporter-1